MKTLEKYEMNNSDFGDRFIGTKKEIINQIIKESKDWEERFSENDFSENLDGIHVLTHDYGWVLIAEPIN